MPSTPMKGGLLPNDPNVVRIQASLNSLEVPYDRMFSPKLVLAIENEANIRKLPRNSMFTIICVIASLLMAGTIHMSRYEPPHHLSPLHCDFLGVTVGSKSSSYYVSVVLFFINVGPNGCNKVVQIVQE